MEGTLGTVTSSATYFTYHKYLPRHRYHHVSIGNWRLHSFLTVVQLVHQRKEWNLNSSQPVPSCLPTFQNKIQPFREVGKWRLALPVWEIRGNGCVEGAVWWLRDTVTSGKCEHLSLFWSWKVPAVCCVYFKLRKSWKESEWNWALQKSLPLWLKIYSATTMPWHINRPDLRPQEPRINTQDLWPEHLKSGAVLGVYTFQDLASRSDKCGPQGSLFHSVFKNRVGFFFLMCCICMYLGLSCLFLIVQLTNLNFSS